MKKEGYDPKVLYGIFKPITARYLWDERWQKSTSNEFVHFWLAFEELYYDYSCFQFGERAPIKTTSSDTRYEVLGEYNFETKELIVLGNYMIEWESYRVEGEVPILRLVPIFV